MYLKTGAGRGLGRQYALLLARRGCKVVVSLFFSLFSIQSHTKHTEILSCCNYRCVTILDCNYRQNSFYPFHFSFLGFSVDHSFQTDPNSIINCSKLFIFYYDYIAPASLLISFQLISGQQSYTFQSRRSSSRNSKIRWHRCSGLFQRRHGRREMH